VRLVSFIAGRFSRSLRSGFARFTTIVSVGSVALGCLALIVSISVLNGYEEMIEETALRYTSHIEVRTFQGDPIPNAGALSQRISKIDDVTSVDPMIIREALARTRDGVEGVVLHGMSQQRIEQLLGAGVDQGAVVGVEVARRLDLTVGDTLVIYASDGRGAEGSPILFSVRIDGIVKTSMQSVDESVVAMDIARLRSLLRLPDDAPTHLTIALRDPYRAEEVARSIAEMTDRGFMVLTWNDRFQAIASWIELQKQPIPIVLGLISIVAVFTLVSTLLVTVVEKTRSIAVLIAIGMRPRQVMGVVVLRAVRIAITGVIIGVGISLAFALIQRTWQPITLDGSIYYVSALPVSLDPAPYLIVPAFSILLAIAASVIPMLAARRVRPAKALRFS